MSPRGALAALLGTALVIAASVHADVADRSWLPGSQASIALDPAQRPLLGDGDPRRAPASVTEGYARLVARQTGLHFVTHPQPDAGAALAAVCTERADLVLALLLDPLDPLPCHDLTVARDFMQAASLLAVRRDSGGPRHLHQLKPDALLAVVEGGAYPAWLRDHFPHIRQLRLPDMSTVLGAVESGIATAAIGIDGVMVPLVCGPFSTTLEAHRLLDPAPARLTLRARAQDHALMARINHGLTAAPSADHARMMALWSRTSATMTTDALLLALKRHHGLLAANVTTIAALMLGIACQLRRAQLQAMAESAHKSRFIGMMSHEVRNSAQAVMASIDLLGHSALQKEQRELVSAAGAAGDALRGLLNRSMDFARMSAGQLQPQPRACDLRALAEQALLAIGPGASRKGLRTTLRLAPDPLPVVQVDPHCLRQILDNLLGNAVKFTDTGSIDVRLELDPADAPAWLRLDVVDSGVGIEPAQLTERFTAFRQGEAGRQRGGSGLGLTISQELARLMGGDISVRSVRGHGSCFTLRVPVAAADDTPLPAAEAPANGRALCGLRVALVEDYDLNRDVIARQLRQHGAAVSTFGDGPSALAGVAAQPAELVLLDIGMDGMDGYQLARAIRALDGTGRVRPRILALSADTCPEHQRRCQAAGMDGNLSKPLHLPALLALLGAPTDSTAETGATDDVPTHAYLDAISTELPGLLEAIRQCDATGLRHRAHRLQGLAQMLGETAWSEMASDLWELAVEAPAGRRGHDTLDWADAQRLAVQLASQHAARQHPQVPPAAQS
ncbi:MAG: Sensor protein EvgS [Stenotrophomonas maltophilia]|uniref:histidine kinase n=1 Tax=Stenotrophomonas maltophilia TaxID=40324 RepID=A0A7V8JN69_STEMA|nr:MAG: Sensor protein EvgS [Stenotrophomonas maltophilia]